MFLNAGKRLGYSFYRFWAIKGKPTGGWGQPYPPPRLSLRELQFYFMKNLETLPHPLRQFQLTQRKRWITQDSHIENQKLFRICYFLNKIYNKKKKKNWTKFDRSRGCGLNTITQDEKRFPVEKVLRISLSTCRVTLSVIRGTKQWKWSFRYILTFTALITF